MRLNKRIQKFNIGLGIAYQELKWSRVNFDTIPQYRISKLNSGLGLSCAFQYQVLGDLYIGTIFQPMFYNVSDMELDYQHYLSFEFIYKLRLLKRGKD